MKSLAAFAAAASLGIAADEAEANYYEPYIGENTTQNTYPEEYRLITLAGIIVLDGPIKCGLGTWINDADFGDCIWKGLIGGAIDFAGLEIATYNEYPFIGAAGKLVHDFGVSIADNSAANLPMLDRFQTDFGPFLFSAEHLTTDPTFNMYFQIGPAVGILINVFQGNRFEFLETVSNLTPVFSFYEASITDSFSNYLGRTIGNVISYGRGENIQGYEGYNSVRSHEFNHSLIYGDFRFINDLLPSYPMQQLHISFGSDLGSIVLTLPTALCELCTDDCYEVYMSNPLEFFAYTMENDDS